MALFGIFGGKPTAGDAAVEAAALRSVVAVVGGRTWYRAIVSGFATTSEAAKYCAQRQAAGGVCFIRGAPRG